MPFRYERFAAIWPPDLTGDPSCRYRRVLAEYRGDSPPTIDPAQLDLPTRHEAEEQDDGGVFAGQRALCLHAPGNSWWSRSMTFVLRSAFHCDLGKATNVRSSLPASLRLVTNNRVFADDTDSVS